MKITTTITLASSLLLAAGCAHETRESRSTQSSYSPAYSAGGGTVESTRSESGNPGYYGSTSTSSSTSQSMNQGITTSDQDPLVSQIRTSLASNSELATIAPAIQISVNNGAVTLSGNVESQEQKQNIESAVQQISGVTTVNNQLQVSSQASVGASGENKDLASAGSTQMQGAEQNESLSPTSRTNEQSSIYSNSTNDLQGAENNAQGSEEKDSLSPTSRTNETSSVFSGSSSSTNDTQNAGGNEQQTQPNESLSQTSRTNEESSVYSGGSTNTNEGSQNDILSPTSRTNSEENVYSQTNETSSATENSLTPTSDRESQSGRTTGDNNSSSTSQSGQYSTGQTGAMNIQVQGESSADKTLGQQISQQLNGKSSLGTLSSPITVRVNDGVVTLEGSVRSQQQKQEIKSAIQGITGVSRVNDQLSVSSTGLNR